MKIIVILFCAHLFAISSFAQGAIQDFKLPAGTFVIETQPVNPNRALVLWMVKPAKNPRDAPDEIYTCPEETRGSFYSGPTRVSLVDTSTRNVINTVRIADEEGEASDTFDLPYQIHAGSYYHVEGVRVGREGKPAILRLVDYNGDGKALEFALFDAWACMGLQTALFGYSERQNKVIQFPIRLEVEAKGKRSAETRFWTDYLFSKKPNAVGLWKFEIDYRGRGGSLDKYEIRYNRRAERFEGKASYTQE